jgi:hypothetical protein
VSQTVVRWCAVIEQPDPNEEREERERRAIDRFRRGATGSVLAAMMTGLGDVLEPSKKEEPAIVVEHDEPDDTFNEPIVMRLDPDDPRDSIVLVRRHLMPRLPADD